MELFAIRYGGGHILRDLIFINDRDMTTVIHASEFINTKCVLPCNCSASVKVKIFCTFQKCELSTLYLFTKYSTFIYYIETKMWIETWLHDLIVVILTDHTIAKWEKRMYLQLHLTTQYTSVSINAWERH